MTEQLVFGSPEANRIAAEIKFWSASIVARTVASLRR